MKTRLMLLCIITSLLTGCEGFGPTKVGVCHDGTCINFEIPARPARVSGKEVAPVQP